MHVCIHDLTAHTWPLSMCAREYCTLTIPAHLSEPQQHLATPLLPLTHLFQLVVPLHLLHPACATSTAERRSSVGDYEQVKRGLGGTLSQAVSGTCLL